MHKFLNLLALTTLLALAHTGCSPASNQKASSPSTTPSTDIHTAALTGDLATLKQHIAAGSNLNAKDPEGGSTPLIIASTFGHPDIVNALVNANADINATNNDGNTALSAAAFLCHTEIVQTLLSHGADKSIRNKIGSTALDSILIPFEEAKPFYELLQSVLGPLGLQIDLAQIQATRPQIAALLK
jgi:ankyrin repeat protein